MRSFTGQVQFSTTRYKPFKDPTTEYATTRPISNHNSVVRPWRALYLTKSLMTNSSDYQWQVQCFFVVLHPSNISGWVPTCDGAHTWWLYSAASLGHHDLLYHSISLSWHWTSQSLPCPNNTKHLTRKWHVFIFKSTLWWFDSTRVQSPQTGDGWSSHSVLKQYGCSAKLWESEHT